MKRTIFTIFLFLTTFSVFAQAPYKFDYQALIRNDKGEVLENRDVELRFTIFSRNQGEQVVYKEVHQSKSNRFGLINLAIGTGIPEHGDMESIDWSKGPFFLAVEFALDGTHIFQNLGENELLSVPFALFAANAGNQNPNDPIDTSNTNELQFLYQIGDSIFLSQNGGSVLLKSSTTIFPGISLQISDSVMEAKYDSALWNARKIKDYPLTNDNAHLGDHIVFDGQGFTFTKPWYDALDPTDTSKWDSAYLWGNHANAGYLTSFTESDPIFSSSIAANISSGDTNKWGQAFNWGNHANAGYLTSFTETDPMFANSIAANISSGDTNKWSQAFNWGNHANAGYLTSFTETDPMFANSIAANISSGDTNKWSQAFNWGNHANAGYLTSFTETDPIVCKQHRSEYFFGRYQQMGTGFQLGQSCQCRISHFFHRIRSHVCKQHRSKYFFG